LKTKRLVAVYRIHVDPKAPSLTVTSHDLGVFDGRRKSPLSPKKSFVGTVAKKPASNKQFYSLSPRREGVFVIPEDAWEESDEMYYCCEMGTELLSVTTKAADFRAINPVESMKPPKKGDAPVPVDDSFDYPIFRITGRDPTHLFCMSGVAVAEDEFKYIYDTQGFRGLIFEEIWRKK
jgi:hypothetical protein